MIMARFISSTRLGRETFQPPVISSDFALKPSAMRLRITIFILTAFSSISLAKILHDHESWAEQRTHCDLTRNVSAGKSYEFLAFPPKPHGYDDSKPAYMAPEECTWAFKAKGNCTLVFETLYYERGDVDCKEQYLSIGDVRREERVCGFTKPPESFIAHGQELNLTHYRRNGYRHETVPSIVSGVVRCEEGLLYDDDYEKEYKPLRNCSTTTFEFGTPQNASCEAIGTTAFASLTTGQRTCCNESAAKCIVTGSLCSTLGEPGRPKNGWYGNCSQAVSDCPGPGLCTLSGGFVVFGVTGSPLAAPTCQPTAEQNCSMVVTMCVNIKSGSYSY